MVAVGLLCDVAVGWVLAWGMVVPLATEVSETTIISGRVGEEKPRSKAPIFSVSLPVTVEETSVVAAEKEKARVNPRQVRQLQHNLFANPCCFSLTLVPVPIFLVYFSSRTSCTRP